MKSVGSARAAWRAGRVASAHALITRWRDIADRMQAGSVSMTANTHRLFANELAAAVGEPERHAQRRAT